MKSILIVVTILVVSKLSATPELNYFSCKGEHVSIDVIYRYENDIKQLYYASITESLDYYIGELKAKGMLVGSNIHFEIMTGRWMNNSIGVRTNKEHEDYYCRINGLLQPISLNYLAKIVKSFADNSWRPFYSNKSVTAPEMALELFNKRLKKIKVNFQFKTKEILRLNSIRIYFNGDSFVCSSAKYAYGEIDKFLPFTAGSKDFFAIGSTVYVIEDDKTINKIKLSDDDFNGEGYRQCTIDSYSEWINFKNGTKCFLSYSLLEEKFYRL